MRSAKYRSPVRRRFLTDETGASLIAHVLLGALFAVVGVLVLIAAGEYVQGAVVDWRCQWSQAIL